MTDAETATTDAGAATTENDATTTNTEAEMDNTGAATTDAGAATTDNGATTSNTGAVAPTVAPYVGAAANVFPAVLASGLKVDQVVRPDVCERTVKTGEIVTMLYQGSLWESGSSMFTPTMDKNQPIRFMLGAGQVRSFSLLYISYVEKLL